MTQTEPRARQYTSPTQSSSQAPTSADNYATGPLSAADRLVDSQHDNGLDSTNSNTPKQALPDPFDNPFFPHHLVPNQFTRSAERAAQARRLHAFLDYSNPLLAAERQSIREKGRAARLSPQQRQGSQAVRKPAKDQIGRVILAGRNDKAVRVEQAGKTWDNHLRKYFPSVKHYQVHDPANSLRTGDIISFTRLPGRRTKRINHVVTSIRVPFGIEISARPSVPAYETVVKKAEQKTADAAGRRKLRVRAKRGDKVAKRMVHKLGIGLRVAKVGTGRGMNRRIMLSRDYKAEVAGGPEVYGTGKAKRSSI